MTEETKSKIKKFHELVKEINQETKRLTKSAVILSKKISEIVKGETIASELISLLKDHSRELNILSIFSIFNDYENINISQSRGITAYYFLDKEKPVYLCPNGKKQAKIEFYSNLNCYTTEDNLSDFRFTTQKELLKKFPKLKLVSKKNKNKPVIE